MRWLEVAGGFRVPVNIEESELVSRISESEKLSKDDLDEREREVARKLVSRGVLNRFTNEEKVYYTVNKLKDVWRD